MPPVDEADVEWTKVERDEARWRRKALSDAADGEGLGCSLYEIPPGGKSFPYHYHAGNAEAMYVLAGEGTVRLDGEEHALEPGVYVPFPADERGAHRVRNDSSEPLCYLMVSTADEPDVIVYPDSEKVGVTSPPEAADGYYRFEDAVGYWHGEE